MTQRLIARTQEGKTDVEKSFRQAGGKINQNLDGEFGWNSRRRRRHLHTADMQMRRVARVERGATPTIH